MMMMAQFPSSVSCAAAAAAAPQRRRFRRCSPSPPFSFSSSWPSSSSSSSQAFFFLFPPKPQPQPQPPLALVLCRRGVPPLVATHCKRRWCSRSDANLSGGSRDDLVDCFGCECYDLFDQQIPYLEAWTWQKAMVEARITALRGGDDPGDVLVILQHPAVYTLGTRSSGDFLLFDPENSAYELHRTERGGEVTFHGPGQLVMYPILNLRYYGMDLHWYLRSLEEVVIRALKASCAIEASRIKGLTGVWVGDRKVAAIGVRVSRWITYHGLALNVTTDLTPFRNIIPCGISDRQVGSVIDVMKAQNVLRAESPSPIPESGFDREMASQDSWACNVDPDFLLGLIHHSLLQEFSVVFGVDFLPVRFAFSQSSTQQPPLADSAHTVNWTPLSSF